MTKLKEIYKCNVCGNVVEVLHTGAGELVCCGQPMELLKEKSKEEGLEKHAPVIEKTPSGFKIKVGSILHPMEEAHYIEWISVLVGDKEGRKFLQPGQPPEAEFFLKVEDIKEVKARTYCNVHGLWYS